MAKSNNQKAKLLYVQKFLLEESDEQHTLSVNDIIEKLAVHGINAERKSIYDDIATLQEFGLDIICTRGRSNAYFVGERTFEMPELKLLVDVVCASKFITEKKTDTLIKKISSCTGNFQARELQRQIYVKNRIKNMNESIYYTLDKIHDALYNKKQIGFKYVEWTLNKEQTFRKNGTMYCENPISLCWDNENYYLITYNEKHNKLLHYRVDKMAEVKTLAEDNVWPAVGEQFDLPEHVNKHFSMFGGEETIIEIQFAKELVDVVIDRFGREVAIKNVSKNAFVISEEVVVSPLFYGWLASMGNQAKIIAPNSVKREFAKMCKKVVNNYK